MKMEVYVDVHSLSMYALDMVRDQADPVAIILGANKREIFALARANIQAYGSDTALNNVPAIIAADLIDTVRSHVAHTFPEID
jgi:ribosome biogenesis protein Tsr3